MGNSRNFDRNTAASATRAGMPPLDSAAGRPLPQAAVQAG